MNNLEYPARTVAALKRRLKRAGEIDFAKVGHRIGNIVARHVRRQFATKGVHFGTPWKPLKPATVKEKVSLGFPRNPLVRTGEMKMGVAQAPMDIEYFTKNTGTYGTGRQKAVWQHRGTRRNGRRVIPPRPILLVNEALERDVVAVIRKQALGVRRKK